MTTKKTKVQKVSGGVSPTSIKVPETVLITDDKSLSRATELLSKLNTYLDQIVAEKERVTKPLNEAIKAERSRWKPIEEKLNNAIDDIRAKMSAYQTELVNAQLEAQNAIVGSLGGSGDISGAIAQLEDTEITTRVETKSGSVSFRPIATLVISDRDAVPDEYWTIDEVKLLSDLKQNKTVTGAHIEIIQSPINRRK